MGDLLTEPSFIPAQLGASHVKQRACYRAYPDKGPSYYYLSKARRSNLLWSSSEGGPEFTHDLTNHLEIDPIPDQIVHLIYQRTSQSAKARLDHHTLSFKGYYLVFITLCKNGGGNTTRPTLV